jgi:acyl-coenzyme A synthetase/AMP-(fatty) acid ligase
MERDRSQGDDGRHAYTGLTPDPLWAEEFGYDGAFLLETPFRCGDVWHQLHGYNIWPAELENAISDHPTVSEVAVIGVPHEVWGETPKAIVVVRDGHTLTADEVVAHCRSRVGPTKKVTSVEFSDQLPKSPLGKVLRRVLREHYWQECAHVSGA